MGILSSMKLDCKMMMITRWKKTRASLELRAYPSVIKRGKFQIPKKKRSLNEQSTFDVFSSDPCSITRGYIYRTDHASQNSPTVMDSIIFREILKNSRLFQFILLREFRQNITKK